MSKQGKEKIDKAAGEKEPKAAKQKEPKVEKISAEEAKKAAEKIFKDHEGHLMALFGEVAVSGLAKFHIVDSLIAVAEQVNEDGGLTFTGNKAAAVKKLFGHMMDRHMTGHIDLNTCSPHPKDWLSSMGKWRDEEPKEAPKDSIKLYKYERGKGGEASIVVDSF